MTTPDITLFDITPVENSSNITGFAFDEYLLDFLVQFRGNSAYVYKKVPAELVQEFKDSASKGAFLATKIKPFYACEKIYCKN